MATQLMKTAIDNHDLDRIRHLLKEEYDVSTLIDDEDGSNALHYACKHRHYRMEDYETWTEYTCIPNDPASISVIKLLLSSPTVNINQRSEKSGETALHLLARSRCTTSTAIKLLLDHGADADIKLEAPKGFTALHLALYFYTLQGTSWTEWDRESTPLLIDSSSDVSGVVGYIDETALHYAAEFWAEDIVTRILDKGALIESKTRYLETPLHYAAHSHNTAVIRVLLARGADANVRNSITMTPLHAAAAHRLTGEDSNAVIPLLEGGAQVNIKTHHGWTALHLVFLHFENGFVTTAATALLHHGADTSLVASTTVDAPSDWFSDWHGGCQPLLPPTQRKWAAIPFQQTPLHWAVTSMVEGGNSLFDPPLRMDQEPLELSPFRRLVVAGADVNATDVNGSTPLHLSVKVPDRSYGHYLGRAMWLTQYLLLQGADKDAKNDKGETAADVAKNPYIQMVLKEFQPGDVGGGIMWKWDKYPPPFPKLIPI